MSESDPNRIVAPMALSHSAPAGVEVHDMAVDDEEEAEDEAHGPDILDEPFLESPSHGGALLHLVPSGCVPCPRQHLPRVQLYGLHD